MEWFVIFPSPILCPASPRLQSPFPGPALGMEGPHRSLRTLAALCPALPAPMCFSGSHITGWLPCPPGQGQQVPLGVFPTCFSFSTRLIPRTPRSEFIYLYLIIDPHFYPANILSFSVQGHFPSLPVNSPGVPLTSPLMDQVVRSTVGASVTPDQPGVGEGSASDGHSVA